MKKNTSALCVVMFFLFLANLLFVSCSKTRDTNSEDSLGAPVSVSHPRIVPMTEYLHLTATTAFLTKEVVRSTVQGFVLQSFRMIGDTVRKGDVLFSLQTKEASALRQSMQDSSRGRFASVIPVKASSDGIISEINHFAGDFVSEGDQIAVVVNSASLIILLNAPYQDTPFIRIGTACSIQVPGGRTFDGKILRSIPSVDVSAQTQTYLIRSSDLSLPENLNVIITIPIRTARDAVVVPKQSVISNETQNEFWIMKLINDSTAARINIRKGIENDSLVQIIEPVLNIHDTIVNEGGYGLPDTASVVIQ